MQTVVEGRDTGRIPVAVWRTAIVLAAGSVMAGLDTSLVNVGLDAIGGKLGASLAATQWISSGYLLALAAALPACGWLGRRFGSGRLWLWALVGFTVTSALCAAAPGIGLLIAARVLQGVTGGLLIPSGMAILGEVAGRAGMGRVIATSSVPAILAPAVGPVVGALVIANLSWHWLFLINVPVGALGFFAGLRWVPRGEPGVAGRLDVVSLVLVVVGLPLTVYAITGATDHRSLAVPEVWIPLLGGLVALGAFAWRSLRTTAPLMDLRLARDRVFGSAAVSVFFTATALFGGLIVMPLYFQLLRGDDIVRSGLLLMAFSLGAAAMFPVAGSLTDRYGGGIVTAAGLVVSIATTVPMAVLPADANLPLVEVLQVARGIGMALAGSPTVSAALSAVDKSQMSDASAQVNILSRLGGALGSAIFVVLLSSGTAVGGEQALEVFHRTFWLMVIACAIALVAAVWLTWEQRAVAAQARSLDTPTIN
ncbi:DHA2 family efflux MFS transporter permease subunit [Amycolatopsis carbonis]|uniref:DHA2 family efflux MFS transporter permease subunit n=1 Tax=Amycolatopsis carbonis TaxID=715471 RepID=A0A9Y2IBY8_9PSEU|nr:DHA2 family efflux MFS transporter permease subunit [Amycolatopsis sp. 2-15]WIX76937.1 DHA2 family efflux MFS transporter permease subunit [Amycolatopsis sp. 2-15]